MGLDPDMAISCPGAEVLWGDSRPAYAFALHPCCDLTPLTSFAKKGRGAGRRMREEQTGENQRAEHQERGGGKERPQS